MCLPRSQKVEICHMGIGRVGGIGMGSYLKTLNRVRGESVRENVEGMVAGDLVRLKSGGPVMTVEGESGDGGGEGGEGGGGGGGWGDSMLLEYGDHVSEGEFQAGVIEEV